jgi:D-amino-acid oxidase
MPEKAAMIVSRRWLLRRATTAASLLAMPAVITRSFAQDDENVAAPLGPLRPGETLPDPDFTQLRTDPFVVAIRPHRDGGVRLELEPEPLAGRNGPKFLIHNYGHSGAGITLSFGCAQIVGEHVANLIGDLRQSRTRASVAVIGSGVIGLTVASELRRRWPLLPITVYAKDLDVRKTTSFKAGGQFEPSGAFAEYDTPDKKVILGDYLRRSRNRIVELENSSRANHYGIATRKNYTLAHDNAGFDEFTPHDVVPNPRHGTLPFRQLNAMGREYRTWLINPTILLPRLVIELDGRAVQFKARTFADRDSLLALNENIIVNCTGYGAKALMKDCNMEARRGHLVVVKRTRPKQFYFFSGGCENGHVFYAFCRHSDIVLGGTVQRGNDSETITDQDRVAFDRILANSRAMFEGRVRDCVRAVPGAPVAACLTQ